jgi:hypothetical protein
MEINAEAETSKGKYTRLQPHGNEMSEGNEQRK